MNKHPELEGLSLPLGTPPRQPNCGITAIAIAAGVPFHVAFQAYKQRFGKNGNWRGSSNERLRLAILEQLGVKLEKIELPWRMNLRTWIAMNLCGGDRDHDRFIVRTTGHVQIVKGWRVTDQNHVAHPIHRYWGRRKFVKSVYRIIEE